ncbi:MAG: FtsX-like permease family protein [Gammaproteobacteria bacterium]|nr:FtsX-like permease family protein [Gammaproteobacteria bacterium]
MHEYAVILDDIDASRQVAERLAERLPGLTVSPWQVARETFYKSMQADRKGNAFTLAIILFIVFIGVLNTVLMSVLERTREFGVLKAIGSRPSLIASLIVLETSILSAASLVIGMIVALPVIAWFTFVGIEMPQPIDMGGVQFTYFTGDLSLPVIIRPVFIIFGYAIAVSLVPGIHAARVTPIEAMRTF